MPVIENPVLRGFRPDPSIVRVGGDYYIATSTFEWFPGVALHHSRDLVHWRLIGHALTRVSQLDLRGIGDSAGVWAPSLSHADGRFWLVYTRLRSTGLGRPFKDIGIFLSTAPDILGPWSDPVTLNGIGFDPSLFHDDGGRKWLVNVIWDYRRKGVARFGGIVVQEYDARSGTLVGPMKKILEKPGVLCEGPNLYRRDGWYYLMLAEGGTGWEHGIAMARSRTLTGPYETDPQRHVLTACDNPGLLLQKAGHGELVQTPAGEWYLAHLAARPVGVNRRCILGREACLQKAMWAADGWLRLASGRCCPEERVASPAEHPPAPWPPRSPRDDFDAPLLDPEWSSLRVPIDESWLSLGERRGWLRLRGRDSLHSLFTQSLVAKRLGSIHAVAETCLDFKPAHFTQAAGLICWYDTRTHYYLRVTHDETRGRIVGVVLTDDGAYEERADTVIATNDWERIFLRARFAGETLQFSVSPDGRQWQFVGPALDATKLSDDYGQALHFTGAMVGLCAQDLNATYTPADFDYFELDSAALIL